MTYLDTMTADDLILDPASLNRELSLPTLLNELAQRFSNPSSPASSDDDLLLIFEGATKLYRRLVDLSDLTGIDPPTFSQCLDTSMIWFYG